MLASCLASLLRTGQKNVIFDFRCSSVGGSYIYYSEVYMYQNFQDLSQFNFELLRVKMSTTTIISLLVVLGFLSGLGNPIGLGDGPHGIPSDFTLSKVQERIHFRGEGKIIKRWKCCGVVCVS